MRRKPKIAKREDGWYIDLPPFGFGSAYSVGPFPRFGDALARVKRHGGPGVSAAKLDYSATPKPSTRYAHDGWNPVIR